MIRNYFRWAVKEVQHDRRLFSGSPEEKGITALGIFLHFFLIPAFVLFLVTMLGLAFWALPALAKGIMVLVLLTIWGLYSFILGLTEPEDESERYEVEDRL